MQHFVEQDVFDGVAGDAWVVEDTADDYGVVGGVVVAETAAGVVPAPGELRASHESVEEAAVEVVEDFFQMVVVAAGGVNVLASAYLADEPRFGGNIVAGDIAAITGAVDAIDRLAIELGQQDVGDRILHGFGSAFEQVGEADVELSLAEANGVVDGDERIETNIHGRHGRRERAGAEFAIGFVKNFGELWGHVEGRVARGSRQPSAISRQPSAISLSQNKFSAVKKFTADRAALFLLFVLHVVLDFGGGFAVVVGAGVYGVEGVGQQEFVLLRFGGIGGRGVL